MKRELDRRTLLQYSATGAAALAVPRFVHARGSDTLRVGVIGCGGRGTGAAHDCLDSAPGVEVVALGDLFAERVSAARDSLATRPGATPIPQERCFSGWDSHEQVLRAGVDLVILATPPHFRPAHLRAAVDAGCHVFLEKPVAVDAPGVREVIQCGEDAAAKGLGIVAGTQRRHQLEYQETIRRVHEGAIGEIVAAQCWWNQGGLWMNPRQAQWSDMEWQLRNWLYFTWLSGDHIVEQHVHNIDVLNWALGALPVRAVGLGGRAARTDPAFGHVFDHFAVEFEYPNGVLVQSSSRQIDNCANRVGERLVGTHGVCDPAGSIRGAARWRFEGEAPNPYVQEHTDLIASIRAGAPLNEARTVAESTLCAILGRMSTYTGQAITWEQALASEERLAPPAYEFGPLAVAPVAIPGTTAFR
jgi:predicted dehydrogenase